MTVRISDVAREAKVSVSTVSMILKNDQSGQYKFAAETVRNVRKTADNLGYRPNPLARSLVTRRSNSIMLIIPNWGLDFIAVEQECYSRGYTLLTVSSHHKAQKIKETLFRSRQTFVDGIMLMPAGLEIEEVAEADKEGYPIVLIEDDARIHKEMDMFGTDIQGSIEKAVEYLYQLGHRKIGAILPYAAPKTNCPRFMGLKKSLHNKGITLQEQWLSYFGNPVFDTTLQDVQIGSYKAAKVLAERFEKSSSERPTAVIVMVDTLGIPVERAFISSQWRIPQDISVVSIMSEPIGEICEVPLTSIGTDRNGSRIKGLNRLLDKIAGDINTNQPVRYFAESRLIVRKSTARLAVN